jgi:hypothetical protein
MYSVKVLYFISVYLIFYCCYIHVIILVTFQSRGHHRTDIIVDFHTTVMLISLHAGPIGLVLGTGEVVSVLN